jgi:chemotaxis signal transduction protein
VASPRTGAASLLHKHVCFVAHGQEFAVPIAGVVETTPLRPLTRVFHAPPLLAGVMSLRGEIVAVLDLGLFLGLGPTDLAGGVVLVRRGAQRVGLLAERLGEVREIDPQGVRPTPQSVPDEQARFFVGVASLAQAAVVVLDLDKLFADERLQTYQRRG